MPGMCGHLPRRGRSAPCSASILTTAQEVPSWAIAAGIAVLFFGIVGYAKAVGLWESHVPAVVYRQLVPHASQARHPMPGDPEISR